jgi:hypothetical protein
MRGVYKRGAGWIAAIRIEGKLFQLGTFDTEEAASKAYLTDLYKFKGGVYLTEPGTWIAKLIYDGNTSELGHFTTLHDANTALSAATALGKRKRRNRKAKESRIISTDPLSTAAQLAKRQLRNQKAKASRCSSQYRGVGRDGDRWRVRLLAKVVGRYDNELDAAHAYDDAARERYGDDAVVNFSLDFTPTTQQDRARHPPHSRFDFTADERGSEDHLTWSEIVA